MSTETLADTPDKSPQGEKLNYDRVIAIVFTGVISASLMWSMSVGHAYRQEHATATFVDKSAEDLRQAPVTVAVETSNVDLQAPYRATDALKGSPRTAVPRQSHASDGTDRVVASVPRSPLETTSPRDSQAGMTADAGSTGALDLRVAPAPPGQPLIAGSVDTERALGLDRAARLEVQRRLALAGFNPHGIDGAFGPKSRAAISGFQNARGYPATGYLEPSVYAELKQRTEEDYQAFRQQLAAARNAAPDPAPAAGESPSASADDKGGCARNSDGRIIGYQSFACDFSGLRESIASSW